MERNRRLDIVCDRLRNGHSIVISVLTQLHSDLSGNPVLAVEFPAFIGVLDRSESNWDAFRVLGTATGIWIALADRLKVICELTVDI